ncbi:DNA mismatch repair protein MutS [Aquiflexum sp. TKW24L]|uniref:MutS-related protein n=1 Tax=Aquiflexum sp. TKW24L TaxID=2942212 RepID=UPI0020BEB200|nr:DNA mismatch repair protein MutS [Aquiflexum sp. TKW24L]MCL6259505.1 DNA mismatch repair protein MutS [Aquiflexum sp. TKW24L]
MEYLILGAIGIILVVFLFYRNKQGNKKKQLGEIQSSWGKPKLDSFDFNRISKYADIVNTEKFHRLSGQTTEDIDFYGLFEFIDRTSSKVGQQYLFKKLIEPTHNTVDPSESLIKLFTGDKQLRESIQIELSKLNNSGAYYITTLLKDKLLEKPRWFNLLILDFVILISLLILSVKFPVLILVLILFLTLNMFLHYWNKNNTFQFLRSFPQLNNLINVSKVLVKKGDEFSDKKIEESISDLKSFQQKVFLINLTIDNGIKSELSFVATYLIELIKAFFLVEVFALYRITKELESKKSSIQNLFNYVGHIDTAISIASLRAGNEKTCLPKFISAKKELILKNLYHPLIEDCVKNNLTITNKSILITGSNMSGKSTFLRSLIINSILAQTIYTCFADEFTSPILKQFSSIRIDDDLFDGKSYYFQEVEIMAKLIAQVESADQNLFVLDEVFKGTNTIERIASAKAILSYLNRNENIVIVATHDIELADMLAQEYDLYHFTETVENKALHFDHTIKSGQLKTRNAIKILELSNYPADVIKEAQEISSSLGAWPQIP